MGFEFLLLTGLLIALPFLLLLPLYRSGRRQADEQLASIKPLLLEWGFQRASWLEQITERFLYKTTQEPHPIYVSLKALPHGDDKKSLIFLVFTVELPLIAHLFLRTADLKSEENDLLYETYWNRAPSDALAPLGLRALFPPAQRAELERRFLSEPAQRVLADLIAQKDLFYVEGNPEYGFLQVGFALPRSPQPQRVRRWFEAVLGLARVLHEPKRRGQARRNQSMTGIFLVFLFLFILLITLFIVVPILAGA